MIESPSLPLVASRQVTTATRLLHRWHRPRIMAWEPTPKGLRQAAVIERVAALVPPPRGVRLHRVLFDGFHGEWISAPGVPAPYDPDADGRAVLYFHGGGFVSGGPAMERRLVSQLSAAAGMPVLSIAYRQLPEVRVAGSVADGVTAYRQLLAHGYAADQVVIAGISAGGHMAFATALQAAYAGLPKPAAIVGLTPWFDLDCTAMLAHPNADLDPCMPAQQLAKISEVLVEGVPPFDPKSDDLSLLPPTLIQVGSIDVMRCDAELVASRMRAAGVPCRLEVWEGHFHASLAVPTLIPEGRLAMRRVGSYIQEMTAAPAC